MIANDFDAVVKRQSDLVAAVGAWIMCARWHAEFPDECLKKAWTGWGVALLGVAKEDGLVASAVRDELARQGVRVPGRARE